MKRISRSVLRDEAAGAFSLDSRQGSILILSVVLLIGLLAATALSVDVGYIQVQKTRMQNGVDAAALAAAQEITHAVSTAPPGTEDPTAYAISAARTTAAYVAGLSGIHVDPNRDVFFGQRQYNASTKTWTTTWGGSPVNTVKVVARRTEDDPNQQDGKMRLFFAGVIGSSHAKLQAEAIAYVEARDIVVVHDFSRSMNFDSHFPLNNEQPAATRMSDSQVIANMKMLWDDLNLKLGSLTFEPQYLTLSQTTNGVTTSCRFMYDKCYVTTTTSITSVKLKYTNGTTYTKNYSGTVKTAHVEGTRDISEVEVTVKRSSGSNTYVKTFKDTNDNVRTAFGLTGTYPFSGHEGISSNDRWNRFLDHCRNDEQLIARGYREMYGGLTFINYLLRRNSGYFQTPQLCKARHYPFSAIKSGHQQLCEFLETLSFDDRIGMVSYDTDHRVEMILNEPDPSIPYVNISSKPLTNDYQAVNNLMKYKQCYYYSAGTNMGGGLAEAIGLLDSHARPGAQPTILLMTDGQSNQMDPGTSSKLPDDWSWDNLFDYNGDGTRDYETGDPQKQFVLKQAKNAIDKGYVIHTIAVGSDADTQLMKAIAWMGGGIYLHIPGGTSAAQMEAQLEIAFHQIASMVPPAKLLNSEGT